MRIRELSSPPCPNPPAEDNVSDYEHVGDCDHVCEGDVEEFKKQQENFTSRMGALDTKLGE